MRFFPPRLQSKTKPGGVIKPNPSTSFVRLILGGVEGLGTRHPTGPSASSPASDGGARTSGTYTSKHRTSLLASGSAGTTSQSKPRRRRPPLGIGSLSEAPGRDWPRCSLESPHPGSACLLPPAPGGRHPGAESAHAPPGGARQAADLSKPIDKRIYKGTQPTCHDFNHLTATAESVSLLVGFSAGQVQLIDPIKKETSKLFNEEGLLSSPNQASSPGGTVV
ncbi:WD repeat-containing protein 20 isoform X2 [Mastomys coucha]|uniref:WD repeat-containing protein 20 isoform X2 n=1 Tax=Mastomys coucha TaxID=35658 RepID=UPI001261DC92|nr:WD repeat-containing protein 20 isoform X2 [Mastomys coucha]